MDPASATKPDVIELMASLQSVHARLDARLEPLGLSLAKLGLLDRLVDAGAPVPLGTLAEMQACVRSNITQLVDRLEAAGLVRRIEDPDDRRLKRAELTDEGRAKHAAGARAVGEFERELFSALSAEKRGRLLELLRALNA